MCSVGLDVKLEQQAGDSVSGDPTLLDSCSRSDTFEVLSHVDI